MRLVMLLVFLMTVQVRAFEIPHSIALGNSDFTSRTISYACFGMDALIEGLPCNPAFTAKERRSHFQTQFFFGNNVSYVHEVTRLLDGTGDAATVEKLFSQKSSAEAEANVQASYLHETWGVQFAPYRLYYYALIRNSALPVVTLYTGQEQTLSAQVASFAGENGKDNWFWGVQLRGVDRRFIMSEFTLTDALASGGSQYFETKNQRALYVEPGLLYEFSEKPWRPQVGLTIKNAGFVDQKFDELPASPDWHLAGSLRPPVGYGEFELGVDFRFNSYVEDFKEVPHLGFSYKLGAMQGLASYSDREYSLGFILHFDNWNGGLTYWRKKYENLLGEQDQLQTVYLELGFII
jgi:hypothetical protein